MLYSLAALAMAGLLGRYILENFEISVPVLALTDGVILFLVALRTVLEQSVPQARLKHSSIASGTDLALSPLAFPTIVTPYVERAVNIGFTQVQVYRFSNSLCTNRARAINQQEADFASTLTGLPREMYDFWARQLKLLGYKLQFHIVDFPNGVPGDIGVTLKWG